MSLGAGGDMLAIFSWRILSTGVAEALGMFFLD
jgi:hypothetical protein